MGTKTSDHIRSTEECKWWNEVWFGGSIGKHFVSVKRCGVLLERPLAWRIRHRKSVNILFIFVRWSVRSSRHRSWTLIWLLLLAPLILCQGHSLIRLVKDLGREVMPGIAGSVLITGSRGGLGILLTSVLVGCVGWWLVVRRRFGCGMETTLDGIVPSVGLLKFRW